MNILQALNIGCKIYLLLIYMNYVNFIGARITDNAIL